MFSNSTNSVFALNVSSSGGSAFSTGESRNINLIAMYKTLSTYIQTITTLLNEYSRGRFYEVASILTQDVYNKMSLELNNLAYNPNKYPDYEGLRLSNVNALHGLYKSIIQYSELVETENKLSASRENEAILYNPVKLREYIDGLKTSRVAFNDSNVSAIAATLKPEYAEYIAQHGYPEGGIFEMDKLADIFKRLNITY